MELSQCNNRMVGLNDAMSVLSGKWKFHILSALIVSEQLRFSDLQRLVTGIGTKMLAKELQDLEMNQLISRQVIIGKPNIISYSITNYGRTLEDIILTLSEWGTNYRKLTHKTK